MENTNLRINCYVRIKRAGHVGQINAIYRQERGAKYRRTYGVAWAGEYGFDEIERITPAQYHASPECLKLSKGNANVLAEKIDEAQGNGYEVYYSDGGHGGPFNTLAYATGYARNYMAGSNGATSAVEIRPRTSIERGGFGRAHIGSFYVEARNTLRDYSVEEQLNDYAERIEKEQSK